MKFDFLWIVERTRTHTHTHTHRERERERESGGVQNINMGSSLERHLIREKCKQYSE